MLYGSGGDRVKKGVSFLAVVLAGMLTASCASLKEANTGNPALTIVNNTGYVVWYLHISPVTQSTWGKDWLEPDQMLHNGQAVTVKLPYPLSVHTQYDILLEDSDGDTYSKYNVTITNGGVLMFTFNDIDAKQRNNNENVPVYTISF